MVWCPMKMSGMAILKCAELQNAYVCPECGGNKDLPRANAGGAGAGSQNVPDHIDFSLTNSLVAGAVVPQDLALFFVGERQLQEYVDGVGKPGVYMWIVGGHNEVIAS